MRFFPDNPGKTGKRAPLGFPASCLFSTRISLHDGRVTTARERALPGLPPILTADSITRVGTEAAGAVVVNGSHGGIYAAYLAGKLRVVAALFNDAGVGRDQAGIAGLDYLGGFGIPAAAVGYDTARIGDGADMMARGLVAHANAAAVALSCRPGMPCRDAAALLQRAAPGGREPPAER